MTTTAHPELEGLERYKFGWSDPDAAGASARRGLSEEVVRDISAKKGEPEWMLDLRLKGLKLFERKPMPDWGSDLSGIHFDKIKYFVRSTEKQAASWDDLLGQTTARGRAGRIRVGPAELVTIKPLEFGVCGRRHAEMPPGSVVSVSVAVLVVRVWTRDWSVTCVVQMPSPWAMVASRCTGVPSRRPNASVSASHSCGNSAATWATGQ